MGSSGGSSAPPASPGASGAPDGVRAMAAETRPSRAWARPKAPAGGGMRGRCGSLAEGTTSVTRSR